MTQFATGGLQTYFTYQDKRAGHHLMWVLTWLVLAMGVVQAEQLPIKTYTTADGLAQDSVNRIVRDSRGFLWFCTREGLSRFDGYQFVSYTTNQGLPNRYVSDLLETRDGHYWVATWSAVCRFNMAGAPLFEAYNLHGPGSERSLGATVLVEDLARVIWCGTSHGLYRLDQAVQGRFEFVDLGMPTEGEADYVDALMVDRQGALWSGIRRGGLYRRWPDGRVEHYTTANGLPSDGVKSLLQDASGRVWRARLKVSAGLWTRPIPIGRSSLGFTLQETVWSTTGSIRYSSQPMEICGLPTTA
jgi:ligand-binding sensor domain-containing protein